MEPVDFGLNLGTFLLSSGAIIAGTGYNITITKLKRDGHMDGYSAIAVVIGTIITLLFALPFLGLMPVLIIGWLFACTGTPMIYGDITEAWAERQRRERQVRAYVAQMAQEASDDADTTSTS